jgi:hypothetical protein
VAPTSSEIQPSEAIHARSVLVGGRPIVSAGSRANLAQRPRCFQRASVGAVMDPASSPARPHVHASACLHACACRTRRHIVMSNGRGGAWSRWTAGLDLAQRWPASLGGDQPLPGRLVGCRCSSRLQPRAKTPRGRHSRPEGVDNNASMLCTESEDWRGVGAERANSQ